MTTFCTILKEQTEEYEYKLCSVENIHSKDITDKIILALKKHGLVTLEPIGVQTKIADFSDKQFVEYPFMPVFITKVLMSNPISSNDAVQSISLFTRIKDDRLKFFDKDDKIVMDGAEVEQHAHPVEVEGSDAQAEVGDKRVTAVMGDIMKDIIAARKNNIVVEKTITEGFVASHHEVREMLNENVERGFYMCERFDDDTGLVTGPYDRCPVNYQYITGADPATVLESIDGGDVMEYAITFAEPDAQKDPEDAGSRLEPKSQTVELVDQDTGKSYTVVVKNISDNSARIRAVDIISKRLGLPKERFIPTNPTTKS